MHAARMLLKAPRELLDAARARGAPPAQPPPPAPGTASERARKRLVFVVMVIYLLAIFEGSLRKYVAPQFGQYVFFIRDPFLIYAYLLATRYALWPRNNGFFRVSVFMWVFGLLLFGLQSATGGFSEIRLLLGIYGWRNYFLYVPLAFLVGAQFRAADLARFGKLTLLLAVPIAVLVTLQFFSPTNSPINVGVAEEQELQFKGMTVTAERIRPSGPFTSNAGQTQFVTTAWAFLLAAVLLPATRRKVGVVTLLLAAGAILTCVALSGSRGTLLQCALIGVFAMAIGFIGRGAAFKAKALALPALLGVAAVMLYPIVFPDGFAAFVERWNAAAASESRFEGGVFGRALYGLVDFIRLLETVPALGYGLGYGGNASITLRATVDGVMPGYLAETDFARHMVDLGPAFGICFIAFRLALVVWLTRLVLMATRRVADPLPMMLFAYVGFVLLQGQITGNGSINVYGWLFAGLCIAATREAFQSQQVRLMAPAAAPARGLRRLMRAGRLPRLQARLTSR